MKSTDVGQDLQLLIMSLKPKMGSRMVWIRIFRTRKEAQVAQEILKEGGFESWIKEDKLFGIPIQKFGVPARFRLMIERKNLDRAAEFLVKKLKPD